VARRRCFLQKFDSPYVKTSAEVEEAFRLTQLADGDPRPDYAGQKADPIVSRAGMEAYMPYVFPFELDFGKLPSREAVAAMGEMGWAEYAADRQEPDKFTFFNLGLRRTAVFAALL
jgi:hypothetical protein